MDDQPTRTIDTAAVLAADRHHLHPFTTHRELRATGPRVIAGAEGVHLITADGRRILDGMSGLWCVQLGYGVRPLIDAGREALETLPYYNTFFQCTHPYVAELTAELKTLLPEGFDEIFYACSGSEANDSAVKLIRYYWNLMGRPEKKQIIARRWAYHGVTLAAASLSGLPHLHPQFDLPLAGFHHVEPPPYRFGFGRDMSEEAFCDLCVEATERKILEIGPERVAAFIGEPVMGAGGMMTPPAGYWPRIAELCRKYDILLWADEVITGFGRTGRWWGFETYEFLPDIITMAKGMSSGYQPISAVALGPRMGPVIADAPDEMAHGFTYSGHPVAAAVAIANIREMKRRGLVDSADSRRRIALFQDTVRGLADHPLVGEVRGVGFLAAIELVADRKTGRRFEPEGRAGLLCREESVKAGLVMRAVRDTMILAPPIVIDTPEIAEIAGAARRALDRTAEILARDGG